MANLIVVGAQWGDEGKGKIVDLLTAHFDLIVRSQGGHNAGHTVMIAGRQYILHLIPSGILHPEKLCVIGNGVVIDLVALKKELAELEAAGISCRGRLCISNRAHVILEYHRLVEMGDEDRRGSDRIGTTNRGIGPAYEDKMGRRGLRICDLSNPQTVRRCVEANIRIKKATVPSIAESINVDEICENAVALGEDLSEYFSDAVEFLNQQMDDGKSVLFEGAQGTLLDVDHGTYPYVTASNATAGGACTGTGVGPTRINGIIGISKAYTTRVGGGPFPTELNDSLGELIREHGQEFGASTGRPRRCGWFDAVVVRYSALINNLDALVITKLDVLDTLREIKICTGYRYKSTLLKSFPPDIHALSQCQPDYVTVKGWNQRTAGIQHYDELPTLAKDYLNRLSELLKIEISVVSTGPDRDATIVIPPHSSLESWLSLFSKRN
jgi:adenylosuccinate synthase